MQFGKGIEPPGFGFANLKVVDLVNLSNKDIVMAVFLVFPVVFSLGFLFGVCADFFFNSLHKGFRFVVVFFFSLVGALILPALEFSDVDLYERFHPCVNDQCMADGI